jgi:hypothetical protein
LARYRSRRRLATIYRTVVANPLKRELIVQARRKFDAASLIQSGIRMKSDDDPLDPLDSESD